MYGSRYGKQKLIERLDKLDGMGYITGVINARVFTDKLIDAVDLMNQDFTPQNFARLLTEKLDECSVGFVNSIKSHGVQNPVGVTVTSKGWTLQEGHHRLAVAFYYNQDIPYVLLDHEDDIYDLFTIFGLDSNSAHFTERVIL